MLSMAAAACSVVANSTYPKLVPVSTDSARIHCEFDNIPLAKSTAILCQSNRLDLTELPESILELCCGGLEDDVANVDGWVWSNLSWWACGSVQWLTVGVAVSVVVERLDSLLNGLLCLAGDIRNGLLCLLDNGLLLLWLVLGAIKALESRDNGSLVTDGEWSRGWDGGASDGALCSDGAECGSLDEVPRGFISLSPQNDNAQQYYLHDEGLR